MLGFKQQELQDLPQKRVSVAADIVTQTEIVYPGSTFLGVCPGVPSHRDIGLTEARMPLADRPLSMVSRAVCELSGLAFTSWKLRRG